ncbi:MAG: amino acid permease [Helicobacteraceae bacterium]|nr:amino acid permease [Helicobacteraceae bacterium]
MELNLKNKKIGLWTATFIGISSMIGSGWMFAPLAAAQIAGGASIYAWVVGAFIIAVLGLAFSEVASLFPRRGISAIVGTISHNRFFGFPFAIANWLGIVAVIALEATASVEYLVHIVPSIEHMLYTDGTLTIYGSLIVVCFIFVYALLNFWGMQLLARANNYIVVFKLIVPLLTAILLMSSAFSVDNFTIEKDMFMPNGISSVMTAVLTAGIIVAFNGFQTIVSYASEIENPHRTIPLSIVIAISFSLFVYLILQVAFIGAIPPEQLAQGYASVHFSAPMVQLTALVGLNFMALILYTDAIVSPMGTAITFVGASTRMFTAMSRNHQVPSWFDHVDPVTNMSRRSLVANIIIAIIFVFSFSDWEKLATLVGVIHLLSYFVIPIALLVFRKNISIDQYTFRVPFGKIVAFFLFIFFNYLYTMAPFSVVLEITFLLIIFQVLFIVIDAKTIGTYRDNIMMSIPVMLFIIGMAVINYISPHNKDIFSDVVFGGILVVYTSVSLFVLSRVHNNENIIAEFVSHKH